MSIERTPEEDQRFHQEMARLAKNQTRYTPGPWFIRLRASITDEVFTVERLDGDLRSVIAELREVWLCPEHGGTGVEANARLIAAAPEMRETLDQIARGVFVDPASEARALLARIDGDDHAPA